MGFVATTLSICDPVGAFLRLTLSGRRGFHWVIARADKVLSESYFGKTLTPGIFPPIYLFAMDSSPERLRNDKKIGISWDKLLRMFTLPVDYSFYNSLDRGLVKQEEYQKELDKIGEEHIADIHNLLIRLKDQAIKTKWVTAEIDRITALVYFIITISVFITALLVISDFLPKFTQPFANVELTNTRIYHVN